MRLRDEQLVEVLPRKGMRVCALMVDDMREMSIVLKALAVQAAAQISDSALRAFPFHVDAYPAFVRKFQHWSGVNRSQISPMAAKRSVKVLAPTFRRWAFSFEKAISMGFKSGL